MQELCKETEYVNYLPFLMTMKAEMLLNLWIVQIRVDLKKMYVSYLMTVEKIMETDILIM